MKNKIFITAAVLVLLGAGVVTYRYSNQQSLLANNDADSSDQYSDNGDDGYVYETDADSAADCSSYEQFDPKNSVCYFKCSVESECKQVEKSIDDELAGWLDDGSDTTPIKESGDDIDKTLTAQYKVTPGEKITLVSGKASSTDAALWQHISRISPDDLSDKYIESFVVFNDPANDTLAFVDDTDENGKWRVGVNLAGYTDSTVRERNLTIVHELGHIVTLNTAQIKNTSEQSCKNYFTQEGCAEASSYLNSFINRFWKMDDVEKSRNGGDVYTKNAFVTEYAASEPEEDIAESFAYFVIDNKDEGSEIKDKKTTFFYSYPELLQIRESMRQGVYSDVLRARRSN